MLPGCSLLLSLFFFFLELPAYTSSPLEPFTCSHLGCGILRIPYLAYDEAIKICGMLQVLGNGLKIPPTGRRGNALRMVIFIRNPPPEGGLEAEMTSGRSIPLFILKRPRSAGIYLRIHVATECDTSPCRNCSSLLGTPPFLGLL